jgi:hypothetical protein
MGFKEWHRQNSNLISAFGPEKQVAHPEKADYLH